MRNPSNKARRRSPSTQALLDSLAREAEIDAALEPHDEQAAGPAHDPGHMPEPDRSTPDEQSAEGGVRFACRYETTPRPDGGLTTRVLLELEGAGVAAPRPVDLVLVVDRSGSMYGDRLEAAVAAGHHLIDGLGDDCRVGIVTYESAVDVRAPMQRLTGAGREALHAALDTIEVAGSTALADGWCTGRDQLQAGVTDRLCRVLLLSDGLANEGEQRVEVLGAWCREARDRGITTSTVGIGEGYDEDLLRIMATAGSGNSWYVPSPDAVAPVLEEERQSLTQISATGVRIHVEGREATLVRVLGSLEVGELARGVPRALVFEFDVPAGRFPELALGELLIEGYDLVLGGPFQRRRGLLPTARRGTVAEVRVARLELTVAAVRDAAIAAADARDYKGARALISSVLVLLTVQSREVQARLTDQVAALHRLDALLDVRGYTPSVRKESLQRSENLRTGKRRYEGALDQWVRRPESRS